VLQRRDINLNPQVNLRPLDQERSRSATVPH
jgi:hypothetical protein